MPVVATPTTPTVLSQDDLRGFLRDVAGQVPNTGSYNVLFDAPEFSDVELQRAIKFTVARYNVTGLPSAASEHSINPWLLLLGSASFLMKSAAYMQVRNQLTAQDGDIAPLGLYDKQQQYLAMAQLADQEFEAKVLAYKASLNLESCYGSLGSGYRAVSRYHYT